VKEKALMQKFFIAQKESVAVKPQVVVHELVVCFQRLHHTYVDPA